MDLIINVLFLLQLLTTVFADNVVQKPSIQLMAFGASIAAGYSKQGFRPWMPRVQQILNGATAITGQPVTVFEDGFPGQTIADPAALLRFNHTFQAINPDWVLLWMGSNDITAGTDAQTMFLAWKGIVMEALAANKTVLGMTILEAATITGDKERVRMQYNQLIASYIPDPPLKGRYYYMQIDAKYPYTCLNDTMKTESFSDGMHPTLNGYDIVSARIAACIQELLTFGKPYGTDCWNHNAPNVCPI